MNNIFKKFAAVKLNPKLLLILGISGMVLILISNFIPSSSKNAPAEQKSIDAEDYRETVEKNVRDIVTGITGDKEPTVVVTLESGIKYNYADSRESDTSESTGKETEENRKATKQSYITVRTSDGGEKPLVVTEVMPEIRGVAIVCELGDSSFVAEKIQNAVTAALDITSQRVYVSGGIYDEEG